MTDTTEPPKRRATPGGAMRRAAPDGNKPRARPPGGDRPPTRASDGDKARARPTGADKQRRAEPPPPSDDARIAKVMARAGLCSRRDAETWIAAGRVAVNGRTIDSPALNVGAQDRITVDGVVLPEREPTRLFLFHKPRGLVTTARDPEGRPTIFENLPEGLPRVVSVGRLDINTEGLMLLTNDGGLARVLELPVTGWLRRYRVRANGTVDQAQLDALKDGVTLEGVDYAGIEAVLDRQQGANVWLTMGLREGKNREIKRVLESLGLAVTRLIRVSFGPFQLGELVAGAAESVPTRILREQLGPDLAAKAGVTFPDATTRPPAAGRTEARPRAHVSALRSAREESAEGPRRRIERASTADRKGRAVKIERVVPVGAAAAPGEARPGRNARRFAAEKRDVAPPRARPEATERPRRDGAVRFREQTRNERGPESGETPRARPRPSLAEPRGDRAERPAAFSAATRRPRETGDVGERPRRGAAPGFGARTRDGDDREPRAAERPRSAKPRGFGAASRDERPPGGTGKPRAFSGRPGGFGSERPATGRNRADASADRGGDRPGRSAAKPGGSKFGAAKGGGFKGGGDRPAGGDRPGRGGRPTGGKPSGGRPPRGRP